MMRTVTVRGIVFGAGPAKIAVPLTGRTRAELLAQAPEAAAPADLVEWRADFYDALNDETALLGTLRRLRGALGGLPLLFTIRTKAEGGGAELPPARYAALTLAAARSGCADLIDVELSSPEARAILDGVHAAGLPAVGSRHDFVKTPPQDEMVAYLREAQARGADIPKLAVMPRSGADVLALLSAASEWREHGAERPFVAISMGPRGTLSRVGCSLSGSCLTFGTAGESSAPGQLPAAGLRAALALLQSEEY